MESAKQPTRCGFWPFTPPGYEVPFSACVGSRAEGALSQPEGGTMVPPKTAVLMTLLTLFVAPRALAASEVSEAHTVLEASISRGTALGAAWEFHQAYSVSVLRLGESGQGFGARLTLLPPPSSAGVWELSADAVDRKSVV